MTTKVTRGSQAPRPTNIDLINLLRQRIDENKRPSFITDMHNLYEKEPWLLQHVRHVSFKENLWFYFVTRKQRPDIKKTDSKRLSRKVAESGTWKTTSVLNYIKNKDGVRVGSVKTISFKVNSETVKDGITTGWVMHEFVLDKPGFQELALCRIRFYPRKDNAQYAPRLTPIVIGLEPKDESQNHMTSIPHGVAAAASCSGEVVSNLSPQHLKIMGKDSNYPIWNGGMEQHQSLSTCGQLLGESSGKQQCPNYFWGQDTDPSHSAQAMEEGKQQCNGFSGLCYNQLMMDHQDFGSSSLSLAQNNHYLRHNNDLLAFSEQKIHLSQDSNLPLTQQQNKIVGQDIHNGPCSAQPYDQYKGSLNNELTMVHMKTEQQQDNVPLINQTMEAQATEPPTDSQKHQEFLEEELLFKRWVQRWIAFEMNFGFPI